MPKEMQGRRIINIINDLYLDITNPGDYYGPDDGHYTAGRPAVWFLLPIANDLNFPSQARSLHHVESPPHRFIEESDGSLTIRESIGAGKNGNYYWHGYLTEGRWKLTK